jgi:hypothetical protein
MNPKKSLHFIEVKEKNTTSSLESGNLIYLFFCIEKEYEAKLKFDAIKLQIKVVTEYSRFLLNNTVR